MNDIVLDAIVLFEMGNIVVATIYSSTDMLSITDCLKPL